METNNNSNKSSINSIDDDKDNELCDICGEKKNTKYMIKLKCGHEFHYECIMKEFDNKYSINNKCPYCRSSGHILPVVNGLKKVKWGLHYTDYNDVPELNNTLCKHIFTKGNKKGLVCNKNCKLGYNYCGYHYKIYQT